MIPSSPRPWRGWWRIISAAALRPPAVWPARWRCSTLTLVLGSWTLRSPTGSLIRSRRSSRIAISRSYSSRRPIRARFRQISPERLFSGSRCSPIISCRSCDHTSDAECLALQDTAAGSAHAAGLLAAPLQVLGILSSARRRRNDLPTGALKADDRQDGRAMRLERQSSQIRRARMFGAVLVLASAIAGLGNFTGISANAQDGTDLRAPAAFSNITDSQARSRSLFSE